MSAILVPITEEQRRRFYNVKSNMLDTGWGNNGYKIFFIDAIVVDFPVLEGTPYAFEDCTISPLWTEYLYNHQWAGIHYDEKCQYIIDNLDNIKFKEHSLFLLKESLKAFSPYSEKAKELLNKLEALE